MANLKIHNLYTIDSEMHQRANTKGIKIYNLNINTSEMRQLNNNELQNIAGGRGDRKFNSFSPYVRYEAI